MSISAFQSGTTIFIQFTVPGNLTGTTSAYLFKGSTNIGIYSVGPNQGATYNDNSQVGGTYQVNYYNNAFAVTGFESTSISYTNPPPTPSAPTLSKSQASPGSNATLSWTNVGSTGYLLYKNGSLFQTLGGTSTVVSPPGTGGTDNWQVVSYNQNVNSSTFSSPSNTVQVQGAVAPPTTPSTPTLSVSQPTNGQNATLSWNNVGATGYVVQRNGTTNLGPFFTTSTVVSAPATSGVTDSYTVIAYNQNSQGTQAFSGTSNSVLVYGPPPPAPTATVLSVSQASPGAVANLSWTNVSATGYSIFKNGAFVSQTPGTTANGIAAPAAGQTDTYFIQAYNQNASGTTVAPVSNTVSVLGTAVGFQSCGILLG